MARGGRVRRTAIGAALRPAALAALAASAWLLALSPAPARADAESDLAKSRAAWHAAGITAYEYGYHKYCECHRDNPPETIVTVRDGRVVRVRHRPVGYDHEVEAPRGLEYYWTVDGLFDLVAAALEKHAEVRAAYDPQLGYPTEIHVDYDPNLIGDEVDLRITRLERLSAQ